MPERFTLVSYMFLHGNFIHLAGNMLFLWVFGDNVEDAMGHIRFLMFYVMCGIFAGVVHIWAMPHSTTPLIGASGAVSGIITAYLMLHPKVKTWVLAFWWIPLRISAAWALGFWAGLQLFNAIASSGNNVAWWGPCGWIGVGRPFGALHAPPRRAPIRQDPRGQLRPQPTGLSPHSAKNRRALT